MPTGYTAKIADGISFEQFIMDCTRAFGACVTMRDDPSDTPIPEKFEVSDYHVKAAAEAEKHIAWLKSLSLKQREAEAEKQYQEALSRKKEGIKKTAALRDKYEAMLRRVDAWEPPSADHQGLKEFMREQITKSIEWDCGDFYEREKVERLTAEKWCDTEMESETRSLAYHTEEYRKEKERVEGRNKWIRELRESLGQVT